MNFESKNLNETCPFGERSTKHFSISAEAPNIKESKAANKEINRVLLNFVQDLTSTSRDWQPISLPEYDNFAGIANVKYPHVPSSIKDVIPLLNERAADSILDTLESYDNPVIRTLLRLHDTVLKESQSDLVASREVMKLVSRRFNGSIESPNLTVEEVFSSAAEALESNDSIVKQEMSVDADDSEGYIVSSEVKDALVLYQSLQERLESKDQVRDVNLFFEKRPDVLEAVLGIQYELCQRIGEYIASHPEVSGSSISFSEVAHIDENNIVSPSPRFLKIVAHNWGRYFQDKPDSSVEELLLDAVTRALEDEIYLQYLFIFRTEDELIKLHGVIPKVCPARVSVGRMIKHFVDNR